MNSDYSTILKYILACACFVAYIIFIFNLLNKIDAEDNIWTRYTHLFQGVEVIVFAAVGWLFGKEVHREQAKKAEDRANNAQRETVAKEGELEKAKNKLSNLSIYIKEHAPSDDLQILNISQAATASDLKGVEKKLDQSVKANWAKLAKYAESLVSNN
jgi:hypothetical protein